MEQCSSNLASEMYTTKETCYVVAMAKLLAPVSSCAKPNIPILTFLSGTDGLPQNTSGSHIVLTPPIRFLGVDEPCLR